MHHRRGSLGRWARKWLYHIRYALNFGAAVRMAINRSPRNAWNSTQPQIIIRNQHDAYCSPEVFDIAFNGPRTFITFPGQHDDCWDNPKPYVDLLQSLA